MKEQLILTEQEIMRFYNRFLEGRRLNKPIISSIILATYEGQEKLFDVKIDTVKIVLRSEMIRQNVQSLAGFKSLIESGIISVYAHENESTQIIED